MLGAVRTVTYQTVLVGLALNMRLVTVEAGWLHPVFGGIDAGNMAAHATLFRVVLAGILFHLPALGIVMAYLTGDDLFAVLVLHLLLHTLEGDLKRSMGIRMTLQTVRKCLAVLQTVTPGTLRHYVIIVVPGRYVGMQLGVTLEAVESVFAVAVLQPCVLAAVT